MSTSMAVRSRSASYIETKIWQRTSILDNLHEHLLTPPQPQTQVVFCLMFPLDRSDVVVDHHFHIVHKLEP